MERRPHPTSQLGDGNAVKRIVFFHPDLGIGGAERLVIDAAVGLQDLGHKVTIFTSHCDPFHCFDEARDGTLDVRVRGNSLFPATVLGRFKILFSILRQIHLLCAITWSGELTALKPTAFFIDQLSAGIPFLRWFWEDTRVLFYCHFPDLLLAQDRKSLYKRIWRVGFDWMEGWGMRGADRIVVNSGFTKGVVESVWKGLARDQGIAVVYPCVNTTSPGPKNLVADDHELWPGKKVLLSINRFEKKKNIALALKAFAELGAAERHNVRLVLAGGYDVRVAANVSYHNELVALAESLHLKAATAKNVVSAQAIPDDIEILFLLSVPDQLKSSLLNSAQLLLYTPPDEHFGIVPLEAMLAGVPVLASNSGGPLETVIDAVTGWLRSIDDVEQWTAVIRQVLFTIPEAQLKQIGDNGRRHVKQDFSKSNMSKRLDEEIDAMNKAPRPQATELGDVGVGALLMSGCIAAILYTVYEAVRTDVPGLVNRPQDYVLGAVVITASISVMALVSWKLMQNESAFR